MPSYNRPRDKVVEKVRSAAELETEVTLSPEEAALLWKHIREEKYRHQRGPRLPVGNPYE